MQLNKKDVFTVVILCTIFFSFAVWNLGMTKTPLTTFQLNEQDSFHLDFGEITDVNSVYFLVKIGSADVTIYTGSPKNWKYDGKLEIPRSLALSYYRWNMYNVSSKTEFLRFNFKNPSIEIVEIAVLNFENQKISFNLFSENENSLKVSKLNDEQNLVECPPTYLSETHFDEIYFVRTAENYFNLQNPYSWSHPPLGKLIIAAGISTFGYNPFG